MRPALRSQLLRPRRRPRIDPGPVSMNSRELCLAALFACARLLAAATGDGTDRGARVRHDAARRSLLARAAASPWAVPPLRVERVHEMFESVDGLEGPAARDELGRFADAFLTLLERRAPGDHDGSNEGRRREDRTIRRLDRAPMLSGPVGPRT